MLRYLPPLPTARPPRFLFRQAAACAHCAVAFDRGFGHINPCFPVDQLASSLSFQGTTFYFVCATTKNETKIHRNCTAVHNNDKIRIYFSSSFCFFPPSLNSMDRGLGQWHKLNQFISTVFSQSKGIHQCNHLSFLFIHPQILSFKHSLILYKLTWVPKTR